MVSSLERAERVALALEARGYRLRAVEPAEAGRHPIAWRVAGVAIAGVALLWRR